MSMRDFERTEGIGRLSLAQHHITAFGDLAGWQRVGVPIDPSTPSDATLTPPTVLQPATVSNGE
jgi:hypothetical protein